MMGILLIQAWRYFTAFGYESLGIFTLVVTCIVLSIAQWIVIELEAWDWFVAHYGDWSTVVQVSWRVWSEPIIAQLLVFVAQIFFAHRCYALYHRSKLIFAGLILAMLASLAMFTIAGVALAIDPYNFDLDRQFTIPALCINLVTDLAITSLTLWKLGVGGGRGNSFSPNTDDVLRRLRNLMIEAAVPPAICAIFNMSFFLSLGAKNIIFTWFNIMSPRFYVCALMFTLNARIRIRKKFNSPNDKDEISVSTSFEFSNCAITGPYMSGKSHQTDTRRTTVFLSTTTGSSLAPDVSMGIVDERVGGGSNDNDQLEGRFSRTEVPIAGTSQSDLQVDLDRWEKDAPSTSHSAVTSFRSRRNSEPPALPSSLLGLDGPR
ncbi:hypothetical protein FRC05_005210 [Tulasnella sp. 425]|nr:hypothetical protein FRC05_005210 [Tulasnella sp. 425]